MVNQQDSGRCLSSQAALPPSGLSRQEASQAKPAAANAGPSREELDAWLTANCGHGLPHDDAVDLPTALHGLSYVLRQIEGTNKYMVFIGQCGPAATAIRWALDHFAAQAIDARRAATAKTDAVHESAVAESDALNTSQGPNP